VRFAVMIEGQEDVTWADWVALAQACERLGFEALFRSDHYGSVDGVGGRGSLDAWGTLCALAAITSELRLGTLVSPATFRHPSVLARSVVTADRISGGRVELGIGTGWHEREHAAHGFPFPPLRTRMDRLAEQLEIIHGSWAEGPFDFAGEHWSVERLDAQPKPVQDPPPVLMGGAARARGAALAARWAAEYNVVHASPSDAAAAGARLDAACEQAGRDPATLRHSLMHAIVIGGDEDELRARAQRLAEWRGGSADLGELRRGLLAGTPEEIVARLREYEAAGIERVMLQHLLHRDTEALELIAAEVLPAFA
jgi:F420-dependent oxidoreductase-like protein